MRLYSLHQKAQLSAAAAIDQLRHMLARTVDGAVTYRLDLSELEDRILLSASPAVVMVESAPSIEPAETASLLDTGSNNLIQTEASASDSNLAAPRSVTGLETDSRTEFLELDLSAASSSSDPAHDSDSGEQVSSLTREQIAAEVVFVDESAEDFEQLVADLQAQRDAGRSVDFFVLDSEQDGIDQIAATLERYSDLNAVHIVSHGTTGAVKLGATWLRIGSLDAYAGTIAGWGNALDTDGDLLIYGCDLAADSRGQMLVDSISALTGADVAASTDDTGSALRGGDWELEYKAGSVESNVIFTGQLQTEWDGLLVAPMLVSGGEFLINDTTTDQQVTSAESRGSQQAISLAADGSYVVVWTSLNQDGTGNGVYARRFDSTGTAISAEIQVNQTTSNDQQWASVASATDGKFVVTWTSNQGATQDVYYRCFAANGTALTAELSVSATTSGSQTNSVVAMRSDNSYVIVWQGNGPGDSSGIIAQRFNSAGSKQGSEFRVNSSTSGTQRDPAVATNSHGDFVVVWEDEGVVKAQRFNSGGSAQGSEITVDSNLLGTSNRAAVSMADDGSFVVVWSDQPLLGNFDINGQRFDASGNTLGGNFTVNTTTSSDQVASSIAMSANGDFIVSWEGNGTGDSSGVFARRYLANGTAQGTEFRVNQTTTGSQQYASLAMVDLDNYVVVWSGDGNQTGEVDTSGVFARQYGTANIAPTANAGGSYVISEGDSLNLIGTASSDPDLNTLTYAWDLDNDGNFGEAGEPTTVSPTVSWSTLQSFGITNDGTYTIGLQVNDGNGGIDSATATLTVNNVSPTITSTPTASISENTTAALTVFATDPVDAVTYSLSGGADQSLFTINSTTGVLSFTTAPDFESPTDNDGNNIYAVEVTAADGDGGTDVQAINISVSDQNDELPAVTPGQSFNVSESASNGTSLGTVVATDADAGTMFSNWQITSGNATGVFGINASTGALTVVDRTNLDFETTPSYVISVTVSDGVNTSAIQAVAITVLDQNDETPVVTPGQSFNVSESATNGTSLGTVVATDADAGTTFSNWQITGGNAAGVFGINASTGALTVVDRTNLDFETTSSYVLDVIVSDGVNTSTVETISLGVIDINEAPSLSLSQTSASLAENTDTSSAIVLATVSIIDDALGSNSLVISGADSASFEIVGGSLRLKAGTLLDFETQPTFNVTVEVNDPLVGSNPDDSQTFTLTVTDVDEPPVVTTSAGTAAFTEDAGPVAIDAALTVFDPENANIAGAEVRFDTGFVIGQDALLFADQAGISGSYNAASGVLTLTGSASVTAYEAALRSVTYSNSNQNPDTANRAVRFMVSDGTNSAFTTRTVTVTGQDDPANVVTGGPYFVAEGGSVTLDGSGSSDIDNTIVSYEWDFDYDGITFTADASGSSTAFSAAAIDGPATRTVALRTRSDNGVFALGTTTVTVANVAPTASSDSGSGFATNENSEFITGNVLDNDVDPGPDILTVSSFDTTGTVGLVINRGDGTFTYDPNGQFESLAPGQSANDTFTYTVSDGTASDTTTVTIVITGVNNAPTVSDQGVSLDENAAFNTLVATVVASDVDAGDSVSWTIVSGNANGAFAIDNVSGAVRVAKPLEINFESSPSYSLIVRATDQNGGIDTGLLTISLNDLNETPTANDASFSIAENSVPGTSVGILSGSDPDAGDALTWSILSGNTSNTFLLNASTGELTVANSATLDFETLSAYSLNVQTRDAAGLTDSATIVVNLLNINETPTTTGLANVIVNEDSTDVVVNLTSAFNDVETPSTALTYSVVGNSNPALFSATRVIGGNLILQFAANANGNALIAVRATDPQGLFVTTALNVTVVPVADSPNSSADSYRVLGEQLIVPPGSGVLANDSDPDGDSLSALLVSGPANGSLVLLSNGGFTYTPDTEFTGIDTFVYQPFDGTSTGLSRTVVLNVTGTVAPPPSSTVVTSTETTASAESSSESGSSADNDGVASTVASAGSQVSATGVVGQDAVVEASKSESSPPAERSDDDAEDTRLTGYVAAETEAEFFSSGEQRLELRDSVNVKVAIVDLDNSLGSSGESGNDFKNSLRFDGEDLSYLVGTKFIQELNKVEGEFEFEGAVPEWATGTAVATTAGVSVGYIVWMMRSGYVMASVLSTMPVWQNIDPLPVLAALEAADDSDDDSLETMIDRASDEADGSEAHEADVATADLRKEKII